MGSVENRPEIEIVPPQGCENFANCPPAQKLVSEQRKIYEESLNSPIIPTKSPTIIVSCKSSDSDISQRRLRVNLASRLPHGNIPVMSPYASRLTIDESEACLRE